MYSVKLAMKDLVKIVTNTWTKAGFDCLILEDDGRDPAIGLRYRISTPLYRVTIEERKTKDNKNLFPTFKSPDGSGAFKEHGAEQGLKNRMLAAANFFNEVIKEATSNV